MAKILFWNLARKNLLQEVVYLGHSSEIDILVLAESQLSNDEIEVALNHDIDSQYCGVYNELSSPHLRFFVRDSIESIQAVRDEGRTAIRRITPALGADFLLVALHFPSKRYRTEDDQQAKARIISNLIREAEAEIGHSRTLVIGDFNMSPFDKGMVSADGFHAVITQEIAQKRSRKVDATDRPYFYNPMWGRMGDFSPGSPGTYYYRQDSGYISYFWYTFDQVLLRPDLLVFFSQDDLRVITTIGEENLLVNGRISTAFSDHLPILIQLRTERE